MLFEAIQILCLFSLLGRAVIPFATELVDR